MKMKFCWDTSQLRYEPWRQKTEKTEISPKVAGLTPQARYIWQKVCYKVNLLKNNGNKNNGPQNTLNMSWNCPNWEQLRALAYSVNSYHLWAITAHTKLSVSLTIKICWFFGWFLNMSTFADLPRNEFLKFVHRISFLVIGNNIHMTYTSNWRWYWCITKKHENEEGWDQTFSRCVCYVDEFASVMYV